MTSLTKTKIGRWFSISEPRLGLGLGHIQCFYQPSAIASALIDFHWEGKSRATPHKKSVRGVGISVVQRVRDCASGAWRNGRRTAVVIEVGGDFCSLGRRLIEDHGDTEIEVLLEPSVSSSARPSVREVRHTRINIGLGTLGGHGDTDTGILNNG